MANDEDIYVDNHRAYCENCQDAVFEIELSTHYHEDAGRWICHGCMVDLVDRCIIHFVPHEGDTGIWVEFDDVIFTDFCNVTEILQEAIQSHGYVIKTAVNGWVFVDNGDAIIMKLGNMNNGLDSIHEFVKTRVWETYV